MDRKEFIAEVTGAIEKYISSTFSFDSNTQLRVNPADKKIHIVSGSQDLRAPGFADEAFDGAVSVRGGAAKTRTYSDSAESPNFYPISTLIIREGNGKPVPDAKAIAAVAAHYFDA